jgi:hypothetical protein
MQAEQILFSLMRLLEHTSLHFFSIFFFPINNNYEECGHWPIGKGKYFIEISTFLFNLM